MRRFFITQHPTFGSYTNPTASKIEASPYFYWWLALTLNDEYIALCKELSVKQTSSTETKLHQIYNDFGDVRYEGSKHKAFTDWWIHKVNETETRGEYLFAEPIQSNKVELIEDRELAERFADDASSLLINIPKTLTRRQIDTAVARIIAKEMTFEGGRHMRNPSRSNARYSLTKPIKVENLKSAFSVYEEQRLAQLKGVKVSNAKLAKAVGIDVKQKNTDEQVEDYAYKAELLNTKVWRRKTMAKKAIASVASGMFPTMK